MAWPVGVTRKQMQQRRIKKNPIKSKKAKKFVKTRFKPVDRAGRPLKKRVKKVSKRAKKVIENKPELEALQLKVNPPYYIGNDGSEVIDAIENFNLQKNMYRGQAIQYMFRAGRKSDEDVIADLKKAVWFIEREIRDIRREDEAMTERLVTFAVREKAMAGRMAA